MLMGVKEDFFCVVVLFFFSNGFVGRFMLN